MTWINCLIDGNDDYMIDGNRNDEIGEEQCDEQIEEVDEIGEEVNWP
jgi:hypothetical protein